MICYESTVSRRNVMSGSGTRISTDLDLYSFLAQTLKEKEKNLPCPSPAPPVRRALLGGLAVIASVRQSHDAILMRTECLLFREIDKPLPCLL